MVLTIYQPDVQKDKIIFYVVLKNFYAKIFFTKPGYQTTNMQSFTIMYALPKLLKQF
jgi:hypothetical protein